MSVEFPVTDDEMRKSFTDSFRTAGQSEDVARHVLNSAGLSNDEIAKNIAGPSLNVSSGLIAFDLQAPAKNLFPVYTPIRNVLPRVSGGTGTATNWRVVNSIAGSGWDAMGWVPEGQRAGPMSYNTSNASASYVTLGEESNVTFEAINAAKGFEDLYATMGVRLLKKMFLKEESALLFGNATLALGTPATPTTSSTGTGSTLPSATYSVIVVAMTGEGYLNASKGGVLSVATTKTISGLDGQTFTLNGGTSVKSAAASQAVVIGAPLLANTTAIAGAVAYGWFVGVAGSESLQAITTVNSLAITAPLSTTNQLATAVTAATDFSKNATAFNGLFTQAVTAGSGAEVTYLPTGTVGAGTTLTATGRGSVAEIDKMMLDMWNNFQLSLDVIYVNAQELKNITTKVISNGSGGSLINYFQDPKAGEYHLTAGGSVDFYYNPFMAPGAGKRIPIRIHPMIPPGTIIGWTNNLPVQYQSDNVGNIAEVKTRQDYYQIAWPLVSRQRQSGVYTEEVLAIYAPFALGVMSNIGNG
jgi:hypothetical protein